MESLRLLGNTKISISDSLFKSKNVAYINIFHINNATFSHEPETKGEITFISNDVEGRKKFEGSSIMEVIAQMAEFIETLNADMFIKEHNLTVNEF